MKDRKGEGGCISGEEHGKDRKLVYEAFVLTFTIRLLRISAIGDDSNKSLIACVTPLMLCIINRLTINDKLMVRVSSAGAST